MSIQIRPFTPADYTDLKRVLEAALPDYPVDLASLKQDHASLPAHCKAGRWLAEVDGRAVGYGEYTQFAGRYHPQKFVISLSVEPAHQGRGVGSALYETIVTALKPYNPISLSGQVREDLTQSVRFVTKRGYQERMRTWESELDLTTFDPAPWLPFLARAEEQGIAIKSLRELEGDPEWKAKLLDLTNTARMDVPATEPCVPFSPEQFEKIVLGSPNLLPDACMVAVHGDRYVGTSALWKDGGDGILETGLTGLRREYRGMGIAQALKVRGLLWAQGQGYKGARTYNESNNQRMLAINLKMGFARRPAWVDYALDLGATTA